MIADLAKMFDAFRAGVGAARAVMDDRRPVLIEDVLTAEGCSCTSPRIVVVHDPGSAEDASQRDLITTSYGPRPSVLDVLNLLADEAERRDGVIR